jgi:hypothetical protein
VSSIIRDEHGRFVQVVQPKLWQAASVSRSRDRTERIRRARRQEKARLATTDWMSSLDRRGICELEATGIEWCSVERWLEVLDPRDAFAARRLVQQALQALADDGLPQRQRFDLRDELYRRMIAAGIVE